MNALPHRTCLLALVSILTVSTSCSPDEVGLDSEQIRSRWTSTAPRVESRAPSSIATSESGGDRNEELAQAFDALMVRRTECGRKPSQCDVSRLAVQGSPVHARLTELMQSRAKNGVVASDEGEARYRIDAVAIIGPDRAVASTCLRDDTVLVIDDAIYDDSVYSARSEWTLVLVEGQWLWSEEKVEEWAMEEDLCGSM